MNKAKARRQRKHEQRVSRKIDVAWRKAVRDITKPTIVHPDVAADLKGKT